MIPIRSKIGQGVRNHFENFVSWFGKNELILVHLENSIFDFYLNREVKSTEQCSAVGKRVWQSSALVSPRKPLNRDVAPIGDDIEPVGESRADVKMGNEEDEEPSEAEIPRVRMNPKYPTSREKQEHEDSAHAVYRSCAACVEVLVGNSELNCWRKMKEKGRLRS